MSVDSSKKGYSTSLINEVGTIPTNGTLSLMFYSAGQRSRAQHLEVGTATKNLNRAEPTESAAFQSDTAQAGSLPDQTWERHKVSMFSLGPAHCSGKRGRLDVRTRVHCQRKERKEGGATSPGRLRTNDEKRPESLFRTHSAGWAKHEIALRKLQIGRPRREKFREHADFRRSQEGESRASKQDQSRGANRGGEIYF